ncbi:hypothetical protein QTP88_022413 [Uroleucon formosanum]
MGAELFSHCLTPMQHLTSSRTAGSQPSWNTRTGNLFFVNRPEPAAFEFPIWGSSVNRIIRSLSSSLFDLL